MISLFRLIISLGVAIFFINQSVYAGSQPKFTIVPVVVNGNNVEVVKGTTVNTLYRVTNQTKVKRTLTIQPMKGIIQIEGIGNCSKPFTLAPQESCVLALQIHGNQIPLTGYKGGPVVCRSDANGSPDPFLCSQPSLADLLTVNLTQVAYITNFTTNSVSKCTLSAHGLFNLCINLGVVINQPVGIAINSEARMAYVVSSLGSVSQCTMDNEGNFVSCTGFNGGSFPFNIPQGIALNEARNRAYVNDINGDVSLCFINPNGTFNDCVKAGAAATTSTLLGITLNNTGTIAYLTDGCCDTVIKCLIAPNGYFTSCMDSGVGSAFSLPNGIALSPQGTWGYVANQANPGEGISVCAISDGIFSSCSLFSSPDHFSNPTGITLNRKGTMAYIADLNNVVTACTINSNGRLGSCFDSGGVFGQPLGIALS